MDGKKQVSPDIKTIEYSTGSEVKEQNEQKEAVADIEPVKYQTVQPTLMQRLQTGVSGAVRDVGGSINAYRAQKRAENQAQAQGGMIKPPVQKFNRQTVALRGGNVHMPVQNEMMRNVQMQMFEQKQGGMGAIMNSPMSNPAFAQMMSSNPSGKMALFGGNPNVFGTEKPSARAAKRGRSQKPQLSPLQKMMSGGNSGMFGGGNSFFNSPPRRKTRGRRRRY